MGHFVAIVQQNDKLAERQLMASENFENFVVSRLPAIVDSSDKLLKEGICCAARRIVFHSAVADRRYRGLAPLCAGLVLSAVIDAPLQ